MIGIVIFEIITAVALIWLIFLVGRYRAENQGLLAEREATRQQHEALLAEREALAQEREDFITTILHEINTPLTPLLAYAAMLAEAQTLQEARRLAEDILRSTGRFSVMKMLTDARLRPMEVGAFEMCALLNAVAQDPFLYVATRRGPEGIDLVLSCEPFLVEGDYNKLYVAVWELVRNGIKAISGSQPGLVAITAQAINGHFTVTVEDNGRGIPSDKWEAIWQPGVQLFQSVLTRPNEGSGYGLDTVRKIAQAHSGHALLEWSEEGVGSRFVLKMPRR